MLSFEGSIDGLRFSSLLVLEEVEGDSSVLCRCDCGDNVVVQIQDIKSGLVINCGCMWQDTYGDRRTE